MMHSMPTFEIKSALRGIVASLHTPFADTNTLDMASIRRLVTHCGDCGCSGVLVAAVAGEVSALSLDERQALLDVVKDCARERLVVVAGISAATVDSSVSLAKMAAQFSVPVVMWQPPMGLKETEMINGLERIASVGDHQIMLQDLDWTGSGIALASIVAAADAVPAFTAIKIETAPAGPKYTAVADATGGRLHLSGGWAVMQMLDGLARGLDAFIPSGLLPIQVQLFNAWQKGDHSEARRLFETILPIIAFSNQHIDVSGRFWKYVRVQQGIFTSDYCRLPEPLDPVQMIEAKHFCQRVLALEAMYF